MTIETAKESHVAELARIHVQSWQTAYVGIAPQELLDSLSIEGRKESFRDTIKNGSEQTHVGIVDGRIIGFTTIGRCRDDNTDGTVGEIWGIYIDPVHWRKGFGTRLASWALQKMEKRGFKKIVLWAFEDNAAGACFHDSLGFQLDGGVKLVDKYGPARIVRYSREMANP